MKIKIDTRLFRRQYFLCAEHFLAWISHVPEKKAKAHREKNVNVWNKYLNDTKVLYLENQPCLTFLEFGRYRKLWAKLFSNGRDMNAAFCCCEVMAAYNALIALNPEGDYPSFPDLLYWIEKRYTILSGYFGTSILGIYHYFKENGYDAEYVSGKRITKEAVDLIENEYETYIFMSFNNAKNVANMIHSMCVTKEKAGFFIHNSFAAPVYYESLYEAVVRYNEYKDNKSAPIFVMGIKKNQSRGARLETKWKN